MPKIFVNIIQIPGGQVNMCSTAGWRGVIRRSCAARGVAERSFQAQKRAAMTRLGAAFRLTSAVPIPSRACNKGKRSLGRPEEKHSLNAQAEQVLSQEPCKSLRGDCMPSQLNTSAL